jgi:deazaflavin-dependent oxidoreductase (nitroreductase family)
MSDTNQVNRPFPTWRLPVDSIISLKPVSAFLRYAMHILDVPLMRLTGARFNLTMGLPSILLTTTGAKSGKLRTSPLLYVHLGNDIAIIGTRFGGNRHAGWVYNLRANPDATIVCNGEQYTVNAREATEDERETIWREADKIYMGFAKYRDRITAREIPIFVLTRKAS